MSTVYAPLDWQDDLPFGKYKGETVGVVFDDDPAYLFWMLNNTDVKFVEHVTDAIDASGGKP